MENKISLTPLKRFFNLLKVDKQEILSIYIYAVFNGIVALSLPLGIQAIINLITGGLVSTAWIVLVVFVIAGVGLTGVMQIMQLTIAENIQQKLLTRSAFEFAYRIPRMKMEALNKIYGPELVNRFFDTLSVQKGLSKILIDFSSATLQVLFGLILLSFYHPFFILFSLILIVIVILIFQFTAPQGLRTSLTESKYKYEIAHWLEELARAMDTFKLAGKSPLPLKKTDQIVEGYLTARKAHFRTLVVQFINLVGFKVIIAAGLLLIGGLLVINEQMNIGQFVASEIIIILVLASIEKLILSMETIYDVLTAIEKIGSVSDIPLERKTGENIEITGDKGLDVNLKNISFKFEGEQQELLKNIDLHVASGEKVCVSGYTGSGKSVLLQIIAGLYDDYTGSVSFNGIPMRNWDMDDLRSHIGDFVATGDIFHGTLEENITLDIPGITLDDVQKIAAIVGLTEFVESLPEGYKTMMVPEGKNLPEAIRRRINLARSLIGNPQLVMLEDDFNLMEEEYKQNLLNYLMENNWTVIAVSNDPDVTGQFEKVAVLDNGKLIAYDSFKEIKKQSWYSNLFQTKKLYVELKQ
jgi:ABC-type bacteriocin/lantibiotic exporter with double-glycine peptidase domain